jgi:hypothetical protein
MRLAESLDWKGLKSSILHMRVGCDFLCNAVHRFNSVLSFHTVVLVAFYVIVFIYDT